MNNSNKDMKKKKFWETLQFHFGSKTQIVVFFWGATLVTSLYNFQGLKTTPTICSKCCIHSCVCGMNKIPCNSTTSSLFSLSSCCVSFSCPVKTIKQTVQGYVDNVLHSKRATPVSYAMLLLGRTKLNELNSILIKW